MVQYWYIVNFFIVSLCGNEYGLPFSVFFISSHWKDYKSPCPSTNFYTLFIHIFLFKENYPNKLTARVQKKRSRI